MQRRLCEMSEAKWSITEAKCLQISHNKYASQRDATSPSMGNLMLSHSAGMHHIGISIAGISKRFHFASLHYIFSAYLPTHIKFLTEFRHNTTTLSKNHKLQSFSYLSTSFLDIEKLEVVHLTTTIGDSILSRGIIVERINFPDCKSLPDKSKIDRENKTELST